MRSSSRRRWTRACSATRWAARSTARSATTWSSRRPLSSSRRRSRSWWGNFRKDSRLPSSLDDVVEAFLGLYTKDKLAQWKELFLPGFVASATNADGTVTSYNLDEFYERQRALFASGKPVSETMM